MNILVNIVSLLFVTFILFITIFLSLSLSLTLPLICSVWFPLSLCLHLFRSLSLCISLSFSLSLTHTHTHTHIYTHTRIHTQTHTHQTIHTHTSTNRTFLSYLWAPFPEKHTICHAAVPAFLCRTQPPTVTGTPRKEGSDCTSMSGRPTHPSPLQTAASPPHSHAVKQSQEHQKI